MSLNILGIMFLAGCGVDAAVGRIGRHYSGEVQCSTELMEVVGMG